MRRILVLTAGEAKALVASAVRIAGERGIPVAAAVVGLDGGLLAFERAEGATTLFADAATLKARTAIKFGGTTAQFGDYAEWDETGLLGVAPLGGLTWAGGICVVVDGQLVAGLGVSGAQEGQEDEEIANLAVAEQDFQIEGAGEPEPERELARLDMFAADDAPASGLGGLAEDQPADGDLTATQSLPEVDPTSSDLRGGQDGLPAGGHAAAHRLVGDEQGEQVDTDGGPTDRALHEVYRNGPPPSNYPLSTSTSSVEGAAPSVDTSDTLGDGGPAAPATEPFGGASAYPAVDFDQQGGHVGQRRDPGQHD